MVSTLVVNAPVANALDRLKILFDSSTPIVVIETVEEMRAVRLVRSACASLNLTAFEWSIATGLARCGGEGANTLEIGNPYGSGTGHEMTDVSAKTIYNSREPVQVLGNLEGIS